MPERILITGATGKTGRALQQLIRAAGKDLRTASRKPAAPDDVRFDWHDHSTHKAAFEGVSAVYLVVPTDTTDPLKDMRPTLEYALDTGIERFVLLSASSLPEGGPMMGAVHAWLATQKTRWTVLRPSWFMQNFVTQHLHAIVQEGVIYSATGDGRVPFIDAEDIAAVAAKALTDPEFEWGSAPVLTGPEALTYDEVAMAIAQLAGRPLRHARLTVPELADRYAGAGLPADYAAILANMDDGIASGAENRTTIEVERITGKKANDMTTFLAAHRALFGQRG